MDRQSNGLDERRASHHKQITVALNEGRERGVEGKVVTTAGCWSRWRNPLYNRAINPPGTRSSAAVRRSVEFLHCK
jgi:hypothetical protein